MQVSPTQARDFLREAGAWGRLGAMSGVSPKAGVMRNTYRGLQPYSGLVETPSGQSCCTPWAAHPSLPSPLSRSHRLQVTLKVLGNCLWGMGTWSPSSAEARLVWVIPQVSLQWGWVQARGGGGGGGAGGGAVGE